MAITNKMICYAAEIYLVPCAEYAADEKPEEGPLVQR